MCKNSLGIQPLLINKLFTSEKEKKKKKEYSENLG
jgi:hypothetical protein